MIITPMISPNAVIPGMGYQMIPEIFRLQFGDEMQKASKSHETLIGFMNPAPHHEVLKLEHSEDPESSS